MIADKLLLGSTAIGRVYLGSALVWEAGGTPPVDPPAGDPTPNSANMAGFYAIKRGPPRQMAATMAGLSILRKAAKPLPSATMAGLLVLRRL